jgi:hypothetical protein
MAMQTPVVVRDTVGIVGYYVVVEVVVSTGDQFKVSQLATVANVVAMKIVDWSAVTCTATGNIVTVTQAGLNQVRIVALVGGQK